MYFKAFLEGGGGSAYIATTENFGDLLDEIYNIGIPNCGSSGQGDCDGAVEQSLNMFGTLQQTGKNMIAITLIGLEQTTKYLMAKGDIASSVERVMYQILPKYAPSSWNNKEVTADTAKELETEILQDNLRLAGEIFGVLTIVGSIGSLGGVGAVLVDAAQTAIQLIFATLSIDLAFSLMYLPMVMFIFTSLFAGGIAFSIILPLTPFIIFWAGQVAWLLAVLEALIAGPIIALGIASPGGHQYMGHAVPATKMLLSIVFRPILMVLGMITGLLLSSVLLTWSAEAFHTVVHGMIGAKNVQANLGSDQSYMVDGILSCMIILAYTTFIVMAMTECFSPIHKFPEKVMGWIGGQADKAGEQQLQQFTSEAKQQTTQAAGAGTQSAQASSEVGKSGLQMGGAMKGPSGFGGDKKGGDDDGDDDNKGSGSLKDGSSGGS